MNVLIFTASPNRDGLTAALGKAAMSGVLDAGGQAELVDLCAQKIECCRMCGNGWGVCRNEHYCILNDDLAPLIGKMEAADAIFLITPVYWEQPSERMKCFLDRVRRCQAFQKPQNALTGKKVNMIAAAGGSGHGTLLCLTDMERWCRHMGAVAHERMGVMRYNREAMVSAAAHAGRMLVMGD